MDGQISKGIVIYIATGLLLLQTCGALDCLNCKGIPFPADCNRRVTCTANEDCNIEQYVTPNGNLLYNVGCRSKQLCAAVGKRSTQTSIVQRFIDIISSSLRFFTRSEDDVTSEVTADQSDSQDVITCAECCSGKSYCNRNGCGAVASAHPDQQYCSQCEIALFADQCETITLCNRFELCYAEAINLNGDPRYRLGCIPQDKCSQETSNSSSSSIPGVTSTVGKRQLLQYCAKCCNNSEGVCNSHLCSSSQTVPAGTIIRELVDPPQRTDYCRDLLESACPPLILNDGKLCLEPMYKNYACRKTCGSCQARDTTSQKPSTVTVSSASSLPASDCYYRSEAYMGRYDTTVTQQPCVRWDEVSVFKGQNLSFPDGGIDSADSFCRDPNKMLGHPWCFISTTTFEWQYCPVPLCQECYYSNRSFAFDGFTDTTSDGKQCMLWTDAVKIAPPTLPVAPNFFPSKSVTAAGNKCRDPYRNGQQQCYADDVLKNCSVPACVDGCTDKGTLNCAGLKAFACQSEYLSITQCAKTCGKCIRYIQIEIEE
ncbi:plasminogen-like [Mya arenaria]|uniref:plasminogen-like n=1 Tax=Mya arenaria TaxID=6604 RepID=UPI0022E8FB0A|nr:plasminogen-like [Mya arenaria]